MANQQEENEIGKMPYGLLISATYRNQKAILKFYDPKSERIFLWTDMTGHKPYCYTKLTPEDIPIVIAILLHSKHGTNVLYKIASFVPASIPKIAQCIIALASA